MSTTTATENALEMTDVTKRFGGNVALNAVSIAIPRGQITALVGDNGAGKSTLVRCLSGVHAPDGGRILVAGKPAVLSSPLGARALGIETVFQELALADNLNVAANIFLGRELHHGIRGMYRMNKKAMAHESEELLSRYAINMPSTSTEVRRLSGGQRQGVAIARAVGTGHTQAVLMDEPTAALGVQETAKVLDIVRTLAKSGLAILLISHNMQQVIDTADQVYVLRGGQMVANLSTTDTSTQDLVHYITTGVGVSVRTA